MDVPVVDRSNRRQTQTPAHQAPPCTLVIFAAGGDLTKRLLMPAIYNLAKAKLLSEKFAIIAVDRTPKPVDAFRDYLADGIRSFVSDTASGPATEPFDQQAWEFVAGRITHFAGDLTEPDTYARLFEVHEKVAAEHHTGGNAIFETIWNRDHIDHVQITVAETVGVELRAKFYEATGAMRDMVPNHVFQLLSLTAMEPPNSFDADAVRTEKHKVLEAVHPLDEAEVRRRSVRGQYGAG